MSYEIEVAPQAARQFKKLPRDAQERVGRCIDGLGADPRPPGCEKISGHANLYRVRAGDYRVVYQIHDDRLVVIVILVGDRRDIYRLLKDL